MRLFIEALVLVVWAVKGGIGVSEKKKVSKLRNSYLGSHFMLLGLGLISGAFITHIFFLEKYNIFWAEEKQFVWLMVAIFLASCVWWWIAFRNVDTKAEAHQVAQRIYMSVGVFSFTTASLCLSALGANDTRRGLWYVVGVCVVWFFSSLMSIAVKWEIEDRAKRGESADSPSSGS